MRVLSIKQPWASMIVRGAKRFEVRSWKTDYRGPLLIHASSAAPSGPQYDEWLGWGLEPLFEAVGMGSLQALRNLPRTAVVGIVTLEDIWSPEQLRDGATADDAVVTGPPEEDQWYWRLADPREFSQPVMGVNGRLNLWQLEPRDAKQAEAALKTAKPGYFKSKPAGKKLADWSIFDDAEDEVEPDDTLLTPSDELARIVGREPLTRQSLVEKVWDYIKKNGLQDAKDPRRINCDSKLKAVIGTDNVRLFDLAGKLVKHVA